MMKRAQQIAEILAEKKKHPNQQPQKKNPWQMLMEDQMKQQQVKKLFK